MVAEPEPPSWRPTSAGPFNHYAWVVLVVTFIGLLGAQGVRLAFGAFVIPWETSFHISRGTVGVISLVSYLVYGLAQPLVGHVVERFDLPRLFAVGLGICSLGLVLSAAAPSPLALVVAFGGVASVGFGIAASVSASVLVARWFVARRGLAFGILEAGFGAGQLIVAPVALFTIGQVGWRVTMLGFAAVITLVVTPLVLGLLRNRPQDMGLQPLGGIEVFTDDVAGERPLAVLARREFWMLGIPFFVCGITTTGMIDTHLIPFSHSHGNSDVITSAAVATLAAFNIIGTAASGLLVDSYDPRRMLGWLYVIRAAALLLVVNLNQGFWLLQFGVVFGLVDFATVAPTQTLVSRYFGPRSLGFVFGLVLASHQAGSALGSYLPGLLFDLTGTYAGSFTAAAVTLAAAAALSFALPPTAARSDYSSPAASNSSRRS